MVSVQRNVALGQVLQLIFQYLVALLGTTLENAWGAE